jgi:hypothetical protein
LSGDQVARFRAFAMPEAIRPRPSIASAMESGRVDEPVNGIVPVGGAAIVVVVPFGVVEVVVERIVVVEPFGVTGTDVVVVGTDAVVVVVFSGTEVVVVVVVVGTEVVSAMVVEVRGIEALVVDDCAQSDSCCVWSAEPCGWPKNDQFVVASTVWAPGASKSIVITSVAVGPVK